MLRKKRRSREFKKNAKVVNIEQARKERRLKRKAAKYKAAIAQETEEKFYESEDKVSQRRRVQKKRRRLIYLSILLCLAILAGVAVLNILALHAEREKVRMENEDLLALKARLQQQLDEVNNPEYIENQARALLRLVKPGEILYILPSQTNDNTGDKVEDNDGE